MKQTHGLHTSFSVKTQEGSWESGVIESVSASQRTCDCAAMSIHCIASEEGSTHLGNLDAWLDVGSSGFGSAAECRASLKPVAEEEFGVVLGDSLDRHCERANIVSARWSRWIGNSIVEFSREVAPRNGESEEREIAECPVDANGLHVRCACCSCPISGWTGLPIFFSPQAQPVYRF